MCEDGKVLFWLLVPLLPGADPDQGNFWTSSTTREPAQPCDLLTNGGWKKQGLEPMTISATVSDFFLKLLPEPLPPITGKVLFWLLVPLLPGADPDQGNFWTSSTTREPAQPCDLLTNGGWKKQGLEPIYIYISKLQKQLIGTQSFSICLFGPTSGSYLRHPLACDVLGHRLADGVFVSWLASCSLVSLVAFAQAERFCFFKGKHGQMELTN